MNDLAQTLFNKITERNQFQKKYLKKLEWGGLTESEQKELDNVLHFFLEELHYDLDYIANAYIFINDMVMEETYYFIKNGKYRYSSFAEVDKIVYSDPEYMEKYMIGLSISDYIWINHIKMLRYFEENIGKFRGERYLEIGPGFGQYLTRALTQGEFTTYDVCDVSKTSVDRCNKYLKYRGLSDKCTVVERNFFQYDSNYKYDCIVMGEVLEHVEEPELMLEKIYELLNQDGKAFITTVINAPTVDHIALFESIEQVLGMVKGVGFKVNDYQCTTEGDTPLEKVIRRKQAITIAMILEK